jgi:crotonobetainyl-CoA:carnitine CoA-transferase CaiB-like acyl-CoA transferase
MSALYIRERTGEAQEIEVSLYNTAVWALGFDISGSLITGEDAMRPQRKTMGNPIRNVYPTKDKRWIMLGMTNAQHYWPGFCAAIERPDLENDPRFDTYEHRSENASELVRIIEEIFISKNYAEWIEILSAGRLVWSPVTRPIEVTRDAQAIANEFFADWDHPEYGPIKVLDNPIRLSKTKSRILRKGPGLGEHTVEILKELGFTGEKISELKASGDIG